jgi:predicted transposase YdaD
VDIRKPHDALFRFAFEDERSAAILLRGLLERDPRTRLLAGVIDWSRLKRIDRPFSDAADQPFAVDLWYAAPIGDDVVALHVIVEHKSVPDAMVAWQVTRYTVRSVDSLHRAQGRPPKLPLVVPLVIYHGEEPWTAARDVRDLFAVPSVLRADVQACLREMLPGLRYGLHDLSTLADAGLAVDRLGLVAGLAVHFLCRMRNLTAEQLPAALLGVRDLLVAVQDAPQGRLLLGMLFSYLRATAKADVAVVYAAVRETLPPTTGDAMLNRLEREFEAVRIQCLEEGMARGRDEGRAEGRAAGQRDTLLRILRKRFGALSDATMAKLASASVAQLDVWLDRVLDATTVDEVLGDA